MLRKVLERITFLLNICLDGSSRNNLDCLCFLFLHQVSRVPNFGCRIIDEYDRYALLPFISLGAYFWTWGRGGMDGMGFLWMSIENKKGSRCTME